MDWIKQLWPFAVSLGALLVGFLLGRRRQVDPTKAIKADTAKGEADVRKEVDALRNDPNADMRDVVRRDRSERGG